ncbi:flagellin [Halocynthiibacter namhaensis]|uniref:flagellin n=1 Tax=Halocynthiibacter namhaensis TaxID=1290553 RepID=UPI0005799E06|nr:flagellin [Halocynthiibacter namhaensis]
MSSILTNTSAMVALQTLNSINDNLVKTQSEISTGKSIESAKDNAAIWAISKTMESDVAGFNAISDSLALGESTITVARSATETVTNLLTEIKGKVVAAQEENVDRAKIQTDIKALTGQINSIVGAAQFNGLNLLKGTDDVNILSSLDRQSNGIVNASNITVERQDLSTAAGSYGTGTSLNANATASSGTVSATGNTATLTVASAGDVSGDTFNIDVGGTALAVTGLTGDQDAAATAISAAINALGLEGVSAGASGAVVTLTSTRAFEDTTLSATSAGTGITASATEVAERAEAVTFSASANVNEGDGYRVTLGSDVFTYVAGKNENFQDVANGLKTAIDAGGVTGVSTQVSIGDSGEAILKVDTTGADVSLAAVGAAGGEASGGLFGLDNIDVSTAQGADAALASVEILITNSIDAAAALGSSQGRIETQSSFIGKLTDSLKAGIGTMVDANMEEASTKLQALQVQQQLGVQSLSIANKAPQSILSLFR